MRFPGLPVRLILWKEITGSRANQQVVYNDRKGEIIMRVPDVEWRARIAAAKQAGKAKGLDVLVLTAPENIYYYSGFRTMLYTRFCCVAIPTDDGDPALVIPDLDLRLALGDWWSPTWFAADRVKAYGPREAVSDHMVFVHEFVKPGARIGIDAMSFVAYMGLEATIPGLKAVSVYDELNSLKQIKSESEVAALARANQIASQGHENLKQYLTDRVKAGKETTEIDIAMEMDRFARSQGSDGFGYPTLVSFGEKMLAPHSPALNRQIPRDEIVRVAFGCAYEGYSGDVIRTYVIGKPSAVVEKLTKAYLEAQLACFDLIKPGVTNQDLVDLCTRIYTKHDVMAYWRGGIGHGLGMTIHEPPRLQTGAVGELKQNMVIAVEPSLAGPDGSYAHCDVVRVTATGCENLSPGMFGLVVIDGTRQALRA